jgi:hypothetical protein
MVSLSNYEEYMLLHIDGELSEAEDKAFIAFLDMHPELMEELRDYQATMLTPDMSQVFTTKESLLRPEPKGRVISLTSWQRYGAAAGIILLVLLFASKWMNNGEDVQRSIPAVAKQETVTPVAPSVSTTPPKEETKTPKPALQETSAPAIVKESVHSTTPTAVAKEEGLEKMKIGTIRELSEQTALNIVALEKIELGEDAYAITTPEEMHEEKRTDLLALLPVSEEKKEGLYSLKNNLDAKLDQARKIKDNLKDTEVGVRIGGRELFVINF